jgi:hypothetical protein
MAADGSNRGGKVVGALIVDVMGIELGVVIEDDDGSGGADAEGDADRGLARPADGLRIRRGLEEIPVVEIFDTAMLAVEDGIAKANHGGAPLAFPDASVGGVGDAGGESRGRGDWRRRWGGR